MLKNLVIAPPLLGSIKIGKVVEKNGKRLPQKDDAFTITSQIQTKGEWLLHPLHNTLTEELKKKTPGENASAKLRSIPVTVMFNNNDLNLTSEYTAFNKDSRPICVGDGEKARRVDQETGKVAEIECATPDLCPYAKADRCKSYGRLMVQIEGQQDELAAFAFRTTGYNSIRTLEARLSYLYSLSNGNLAGMPLTLKLRGKSTAQSFREAIFYVDLEVREGMSFLEAVKKAKARATEWEEAGLNRTAFEAAALAGMQNGVFTEIGDDVGDILEEFWADEYHEPEQSDLTSHTATVSSLSGLSALVNNEPKTQPKKPQLTNKAAPTTSDNDGVSGVAGDENDLFGAGTLALSELPVAA